MRSRDLPACSVVTFPKRISLVRSTYSIAYDGQRIVLLNEKHVGGTVLVCSKLVFPKYPRQTEEIQAACQSGQMALRMVPVTLRL
jgi:hypothetical protein